MDKKVKQILLLFFMILAAVKLNVAIADEESSHEKEISGLIREYIAGRIAVTPSEIEVRLLNEFGEPQKEKSVHAKLSIREANATSLLGNAKFLVVSEDPLQKIPPLWVNARSEWVHPTAVVVRSLKKYQIVEPEDVTLQIIRSDHLEDYFSRVEDLFGKRVVQQERAGTVLTREMVENPPLFHQGERVTLMVETGHVKVMAQGKALEDGFKGKSISVLNLDSHRTVYGEPLDGSTVRVVPARD